MTVNFKGSGIGNSGAFMRSGIPFLSASVQVPNGSAIEVSFPQITRAVTIKNINSSTVRVGASENGVAGSSGNFYFRLTSQDETLRLETALSSIFLYGQGGAGVVDIAAELTTIRSREAFPPSPSKQNWSGSQGVG